MILETDRLILRPWQECDAETLYEYARDPRVGPVAGWEPHKSVEYSLNIIRGVLSSPETYALALKTDNRPIGSAGIMFGSGGSLPMKQDEAEIGYWTAVPFWGRGYAPEAVGILLRRCFYKLGCAAVWCGYYEGNDKSRRVQEKCGFVYHHSVAGAKTLLGDVRTQHFTRIERGDFLQRQK